MTMTLADSCVDDGGMGPRADRPKRRTFTAEYKANLLAEYEARRAAHLAVEATAEADLPAELRGNERVDTYTRCSRYLAGRARARRLADAGV